MVILGLDLSLVGTGYVKIIDNKMTEQKLIKSKPSGNSYIKELERLMKIRKEIYVTGCDLAVIEGIAFMIRNSTSIVQLSALNYMVRELLYSENVPFVIVPPPTLKKFITGKGNAKKDQMMLETYKKYNESFDDDNVCDAYGLAQIGTTLMGNPDGLPIYQQEVINTLKRQL